MGLNETYVVLIPKKPKPEFIIDFMPIALCTVLYKVVVKMLASQLKLVFGVYYFGLSECFYSR